MYGYNPRSIKKSSDARLIVAKFSLATGEERLVNLINVYKGVPISHDATVIKVINERLTLKFHHDQALMLNLDGQTYIQTRLLSSPIKATVMTINTTEQLAILTDLTFTEPDFRKRESIRVELDLEDAPNVTVSAPDNNVYLFGKLNDISRCGVGVMVIAIEDIISKIFVANSVVELAMMLPDPDKKHLREIKMWGEIRHLDHAQENYKLGVKTYPHADDETCIAEFISRRKAEILDEVEQYNRSMDLRDWVVPG